MEALEQKGWMARMCLIPKRMVVRWGVFAKGKILRAGYRPLRDNAV